MSQQQRSIEVTYASGRIGTGVATGNNGAMICDCDARTQLVGYSDAEDSGRESSLVVCPHCGSRYRILAPYLRGRALEIRAVTID